MVLELAGWVAEVRLQMCFGAGIEALHAVVPEAVPLPPVAGLAHETEATPTPSEAVPLMASGVVEVLNVGLGGVLIATAGGVVSEGV